MKNTIEQHSPDYKTEIWKEYTMAELGYWVHLLSKRAGHRSDRAKRVKDLEDARNYLAMMDAKLTELEGK